jgi:hypothetical protein
MSDGYMYVDADTGKPINVPNQMPQPSYIPTHTTKDNKADLLEKIRPDAIVEVIRNKLMGYDFNDLTKKWELNQAYKMFALTPLGASQIANLMLGVSSQNVSLSNLKDFEIKTRLRSIAKTAQYLCIENWESYGIKSASQLHFVHEIVFSNTLVVLKQPEGEGIRKLLAGTIQESRVYNSNVEEKKKGMISRWLNR